MNRKPRHSDTLIIYDTETTGLISNMALPLKDQPSIIELYALKLDANTFDMLEDWHSLFWVKSVPAEVTTITGITTEMLSREPKFAMKFDSLCDFFLGTRYVCGHNLSYDLDMLSIELRRMEMQFAFPWPPLRTCTVEATEGEEGFRLGLSVLHERLFGEAFDGSHRAQADVEATARCLRKLAEEGKVKL